MRLLRPQGHCRHWKSLLGRLLATSGCHQDRPEGLRQKNFVLLHQYRCIIVRNGTVLSHGSNRTNATRDVSFFNAPAL